MNTQSSLQTQASQGQQRTDIHLRDYLPVLRRRFWLILIAFIVTTSSTAFYLVRKPAQYEATAVVRIPTSGGGGGLAAALGNFLPVGPASDVASEIESREGYQGSGVG